MEKIEKRYNERKTFRTYLKINDLELINKYKPLMNGDWKEERIGVSGYCDYFTWKKEENDDLWWYISHNGVPERYISKKEYKKLKEEFLNNK